MAEVTVVIPTKDRWALLQRGLATVLDQEGVAVEVVVVDDGSASPAPDDSRVLTDPRVRVLRNEQSRRQASARNRGIAAAESDWIAFLDDDDLWAPHKLAVQVEAAEREGAEFVYSSAVIVDQRLAPLRLELAPPFDRVVSGIRTHAMIPAGTSSVVAHRSLLERTGGFDETLRMADDWDMWIRLAGAGRGCACAEVLVAYVEHPDNMHMADLAGLREVDAIIARYSGSPEARRRAAQSAAKWRARTHLRAGRRGLAAREHLRFGLRHRDRTSLVAAARALLGPGAVSASRESLRDPSVCEPEWLPALRARFAD